jgi:GTP-binding protein Era
MIAITGRPNVGKSTLLNALVGDKISVVTNKPQTTRGRIRGVVNRGDTQLVLLDTPGFHKPHTKLGDYMVGVVRESVADTDAAVLVVEPIPNVGTQEAELIERFRAAGVPAVLAVNKIDTVRKDALLEVTAAYAEAFGFAAIVPVCAKSGEGLPELTAELAKFAAPGPELFPGGMTTDQPDKSVVAEIIREKLLICLDREVPHGTAVEIAKFSERDSEIIDVEATIYCEKQSHKGIIIGKSGAMLKKIATMARLDAERFMGTKVYLQIWVKVRENWRDNADALRGLGFGEK